MERNEIYSVAVDCIKGVKTNFSNEQNSEDLISAFIALNGGSTKINPKTFRPGNELFELIQELIPVIIDEGFKAEGNPLYNYVDYRNLAYGDSAEFDIEGEANFIVATAAKGIQGIRRQRILDGEAVKVDTYMKAVRVYENLGRLLARRIDFNKFVNGVAKAFINDTNKAIYDALTGITTATAGLNSTYVKSGSISVAALLTLVEHVEAATGKKAAILGTKTAIRKLGSAVTYSAEQNSDLYNQGYLGMIDGVPAIALKQVHEAGTDTFGMKDDCLFVVAADDKFIKVVNVGDGLLFEHEAQENADLTREYFYGQEIGVGIAVASKLGYWYSIV